MTSGVKPYGNRLLFGDSSVLNEGIKFAVCKTWTWSSLWKNHLTLVDACIAICIWEGILLVGSCPVPVDSWGRCMFPTFQVQLSRNHGNMEVLLFAWLCTNRLFASQMTTKVVNPSPRGVVICSCFFWTPRKWMSRFRCWVFSMLAFPNTRWLSSLQLLWNCLQAIDWWGTSWAVFPSSSITRLKGALNWMRPTTSISAMASRLPVEKEVCPLPPWRAPEVSLTRGWSAIFCRRSWWKSCRSGVY